MCLSLDWLINISALYTPTVVYPDVLILLTVVFYTRVIAVRVNSNFGSI